MNDTKKLELLYRLAREDEIYQTWKNSWEMFSDDFFNFARQQTPYVRNFLLGYAETGQMMLQSLVNIACKRMDFIEKDEL